MSVSSQISKLVTCIVILHLTKAEIFTSVQDLTETFAVERKVVDALSEYLKKTEVRLERIRRYLSDYEQVRAEEGGVPYNITEADETWLLDKLAGNPIHVFHLIKRLTVDWKHIGGQAPREDWKGVEDALLTSGMLMLPHEEDLQGAAQAIVRLQSVYQLNTTNLVQGNFLGIQSSAGLRAQDCLYMGKHSFNMGLYYNAIEWFEEAYTLAGLERNVTVTQSQVMNFLNAAIKAYDETIQGAAAGYTSEKIEPTPVRLNPFTIINKAKQLHTSSKEYKLGLNISSEDDFGNFEALCRGEQLLSEKFKKSLRCFYDRRGSHFLTLMPAKVEQYHINPEIIIFHDAISEKEITLLKSMATPQLSRAMVQGLHGQGNTISSTRTSKVAWVNSDDEDKYLASVNRRISHLTGLSTDTKAGSAELLQIANYGIGGHYNPHHDYLLVDKTKYELENNVHPRELELGDRIATFMFYLTDVSRGGATVFPKLGVSLWPSKGTAAFWYNLKKSGEGDRLTLHGACPVIFGSKWVSNKWIRERAQIQQRPCGLRPEE